MAAAEELASVIGVQRACEELFLPRSGFYRRRRRRPSPPSVGAQRSSARRLKDEEKSAVLACLHEERFQDCSPAQVYASLLDDGQYHCSIRTMYRLLDAKAKIANAAITHSPALLKRRNYWLAGPISSGAGTSPNCAGP